LVLHASGLCDALPGVCGDWRHDAAALHRAVDAQMAPPVKAAQLGACSASLTMPESTRLCVLPSPFPEILIFRLPSILLQQI
jgi:hypothetical protein